MLRNFLFPLTKHLRSSLLVVFTTLILTQQSHAALQNGDFSAGTTGWALGQYGGASSNSIDNGRYKLLVTQAGSAWWNVQLQQGGQLLQQGKKYRLKFDAFKGPENAGVQQVEINVGQASGTYASYTEFPNKLLTLTTTATTYTFPFTMGQATDAAARVEFNAGLNTGSLYLDNVSLQEVVDTVPQVQVSSTSLSFGSIALGETKTQALTLTNTGGAPLNISSISSDNPVFTLAGQTSLNLAAGASATITLTYQPSALGNSTGTLRIDSNAQNQPQLLISLSGKAVDVGTTIGYQPKSDFLLHPELALDFVKSTAEFRLLTRDNVKGGFNTFINRNGSPSGANQKSMNGQSRLAYGFVRTFQLTGDEKYLENAHHALTFLYDHGWQDGWNFVTDDAGTPILNHWGHTRWWSFQQHYALLGIGAMVEATGGQMNWGDGVETDLTWLNRGVNSNYTRLWDGNLATLGYFDFIDRSWTNPSGKGFTPTVDAITTHASILATMFNDAQHEQRLRDLADVIVKRFAGNMRNATVGFPEFYDANWNIDATNTTADIGHLYKTSWVLLRAFLNNPTRTDYRDAAHAIFANLTQADTFDKVNGGIYSTLNWQTGVTTSTNKNHWKLEQGFNSGMINYYTATSQADKDTYLEVADGSIDFYMNRMRDTAFGDTWSEMNKDGTVIVDADKGGLFTAGYHSIELGYYVYMYGNLYYHLKPVQLYYKYPIAAQARAIKLTPIDIEDNQLIVTAVEKDGVPYTAFNGTSRTLQLPAGTGGKFKVTFERPAVGSSSSSSVASSKPSSVASSKLSSIASSKPSSVASSKLSSIASSKPSSVASSKLSSIASSKLSSVASSIASSKLSSVASSSKSSASSVTGLAQAACTVKIASEWAQGFTASVDIENLSTTAITGWQLQIQFLQPYAFMSAWNASSSSPTSAGFTASNFDWNAAIAPGQKVSFGFQAGKLSEGSASVSVKGTICR